MQDFLTTCERAARAGGRVLLDWRDRFQSREKGPRDLVTEADLASQRTIQEIVLGTFPEHAFLGEEGAGVEAVGQPRWIVDPLDGTMNYVHQLPGYAVSVALEHEGRLLAAAVYDPLLDEMYTAAAGEGARLNDRPIQVSHCTGLPQALVAASFSTDVQIGSVEMRRFEQVLVRAQSLRRLGSAALNLCYLSAGRLDAYWATSVKIWDVAAGILLLREAGGVVYCIDGGALDLHDPRFVAASTASLHGELDELLRRAA